MIKISKEMIIGDILDEAPDMGAVLMAAGMHCIGCPSAQMESVEEAAYVHGIEPDLLVTRVNAFVESQAQEAKLSNLSLKTETGRNLSDGDFFLFFMSLSFLMPAAPASAAPRLSR